MLFVFFKCYHYQFHRLTFLKRYDRDFEGLQRLSVQLGFGLDLSRGGINFQPVTSLTIQFEPVITHTHTHTWTKADISKHPRY